MMSHFLRGGDGYTSYVIASHRSNAEFVYRGRKHDPHPHKKLLLNVDSSQKSADHKNGRY